MRPFDAERVQQVTNESRLAGTEVAVQRDEGIAQHRALVASLRAKASVSASSFHCSTGANATDGGASGAAGEGVSTIGVVVGTQLVAQ